MPRRIAIAAGALALLLVFVASENHLSYSFNACVSQERGHQSANNSDNYGFIIGRFLERQGVCSVRLLDAHNGFITAIAGIAVALFTFTLWRSTERLWTVSDRQAAAAERALDEQERPWVMRDIVHVRWRGLPAVKDNDWEISIRWKNFGRSPALLSDCIFKIEDKDTLPPKPDYANAAHLPIIDALTPNGSRDYDTQAVGLNKPGTKDGKPIEYVFYGRVTYREMNGKIHHSGFAVMLAPHFAAAMDYPKDTYNYYT